MRRSLLDLVVAPSCWSCRTPLRGGALCAPCERVLPWLDRPLTVPRGGPLAAAWAECWRNIDAGKDVDSNRYELRAMMEFAGLKDSEPPREFTNQLHEAYTRVVLQSRSWLAIFQITDVFGMTARFNTPGSVAATNWSYRLPNTVKELDEDAVLLAQTEMFSRLAQETGRVS